MIRQLSKVSIGIIAVIVLFAVISITFLLRMSSDMSSASSEFVCHYKEVNYPTPNIDPDSTNKVLGVILHHTAEPTAESALKILSSPEKKVGTHVVIDTDGTRYVMAEPTVVAYHAGYSILNGLEGCNYFTIGIEFQGNTLKAPLTEEQIESGTEYLIPIINTYNIPLENIVTHQMIRNAYKEKYPNKRCSGKVDITQPEYQRFMNHLRKIMTANND